MKRTLIILAVILAAGSAMAQEWGDYGGVMGVYFSDTEFTEATAILMTDPAPFNMYIVLLDAQVADVGGYECGIAITDPAVFILSATGPNGWANYGQILNHLAAYTTPLLPSAEGSVVLSTLLALYAGTDEVDIIMGPSSPSSGAPGNPYGLTWDGPIIGGWYNPDILYFCHLSSGAADYPDVVAQLNPAPLATEQQSWTQVKGLFE